MEESRCKAHYCLFALLLSDPRWRYRFEQMSALTAVSSTKAESIHVSRSAFAKHTDPKARYYAHGPRAPKLTKIQTCMRPSPLPASSPALRNAAHIPSICMILTALSV